MATLDQVAVEEDDGDRDSALGDTNRNSMLSTESLTPNVYNFIDKHGRTYHSYHEGKYPFPNDEAEQERLDFQHALHARILGGRLFLAPIVRPRRVLDLGCGTGIWAIQFADLYPEAIVVGVDLSPIQPDWVPPNCIFEVFDYDDDWTFGDEFDFIHVGVMIGCITDLDKLLRRALNHLRPGGFMEFLDVCPPEWNDKTVFRSSFTYQWRTEIGKAFKIIGRGLFHAEEYQPKLCEAGFTDVVIHRFPEDGLLGDDSLEELSTWQRENMELGIDGFSKQPFLEELGWSQDELNVLLARVRNEIRNKRLYVFWPVYVVYGRKSQAAIEEEV